MQPHRHLLCPRSGMTPRTGPNQSQTPHHRFCQLNVESSDGSLSTSIFPMVCADTSSTFSASTTQYLGSLSLGTFSTFLYRPPSQPKVSTLQNSSASFVIFSMHVRCLLITPGSGAHRNQSCMPGPLMSAFVQLPDCMWDQLDKQYTAEN